MWRLTISWWCGNRRTIDDPESCLYSAFAVTPPIHGFRSCRLGKITHTECMIAMLPGDSVPFWNLCVIQRSARFVFHPRKFVADRWRGLTLDLDEEKNGSEQKMLL